MVARQNSWFRNQERIDALTTESRSWLGTPFRANAAIKGAGVCCHLFVAEVLMEVGAIPRQPFPKANPNHSIAQKNSLIEAFMDSFDNVVRVEGEPLPGDILGFRIGGCTHHISLVLPAQKMIHAVRRYGVIESCRDDPMWQRRLTHIWRVSP